MGGARLVKSFAVAGTGLSVFLYMVSLLNGQCFLSVLALVIPLLLTYGSWKLHATRSDRHRAFVSVSLEQPQAGLRISGTRKMASGMEQT